MARLTGKTALVTGGGSGIGLATTRLLLAEGARVAIAGRDADKLRRAAADLGAGDRLVWHAADVSKADQARALADEARRRLGRVDILINNAGANVKERQFRQLTRESYDLLMGGNLHGAFLVTQALLPQMLQRKDGLVVFVNSVAGRRAGPLGGAAYAAAKFGLRGLAMALAAEEKDSGVRVSSIYPGEVDTPILEHRPAAVTDEHRRRILKPEDIAAAVLFVVTLPPHVVVPELVITPASQMFI
jgi:NADP-dependent 3-hydroxy acid dehydrogenase YdfG